MEGTMNNTNNIDDVIERFSTCFINNPSLPPVCDSGYDNGDDSEYSDEETTEDSILKEIYKKDIKKNHMSYYDETSLLLTNYSIVKNLRSNPKKDHSSIIYNSKKNRIRLFLELNKKRRSFLFYKNRFLGDIEDDYKRYLVSIKFTNKNRHIKNILKHAIEISNKHNRTKLELIEKTYTHIVDFLDLHL